MTKQYTYLSDENGDSIVVRRELEKDFIDFYNTYKKDEEKLDDTYWRFLSQYYAPSPTRRARISMIRKAGPHGDLYRGKDILSATESDIEYDLAEEVAVSILASEFRLAERRSSVKRATISSARDSIFKSVLNLVALSREHNTAPDGSREKLDIAGKIDTEVENILASKTKLESVRASGDVDEFNRPFAGGFTVLDYYLKELAGSPPGAINYSVVKSLVANDAELKVSDDIALALARNLLATADAKSRGVIKELNKAGLEIFFDSDTREPCAITAEKRALLEEQRRLEEERIRQQEEQARIKAARKQQQEQARIEAARKQQEEIEAKERAERELFIHVRAKDAARRAAWAREEAKMAAIRSGTVKEGDNIVISVGKKGPGRYKKFSFSMAALPVTPVTVASEASARDSGDNALPIITKTRSSAAYDARTSAAASDVKSTTAAARAKHLFS